ncbi:MAG: TetR/AcrR family transcriptional regulator [Actinomycetota bacterium]|nr:TetR/AcrR family transcriptional regulator [Actinomycetota bacterium]
MTQAPPSARQASLLDGLVAVFLADGFASFTLDELAHRLHCSKSTLYALAGSKEQLVVRVVRQFFASATGRVEAEVAASGQGLDAIAAYLRAVSAALAPASVQFFADLAAFAPADEIYAHNTSVAARRVQQLIDEGVATGAVRPVHAGFVSAVVTQAMTAIHAGDIARASGLDDAAAYDHLAELVVSALSPPA